MPKFGTGHYSPLCRVRRETLAYLGERVAGR